MSSFGFPIFYASLINPSGEYQIGDKIYWFHDGYKYEARSESELSSIKSSPSQATTKYVAGCQTVVTGVKNIGSESGKSYSPRVTTATSGMPLDYDKWPKEFNAQGDPGSRRRVLYSIRTYIEDRGTNPVITYAHYFYTSQQLVLKYKFYSNGRRAWYPANGQNFNWTVNVNYTGTVNGPNIQTSNSPGVTRGSIVNTSGAFSTGAAYFSLLETTVSLYTYYQDYTVNNVSIKYNIDGTIKGIPQEDPARGSFVVTGNLW